MYLHANRLDILTNLLRWDRQIVAKLPEMKCASLCRMWRVDLPPIVGGGLDAPALLSVLTSNMYERATNDHTSLKHGNLYSIHSNTAREKRK